MTFLEYLRQTEACEQAYEYVSQVHDGDFNSAWDATEMTPEWFDANLRCSDEFCDYCSNPRRLTETLDVWKDWLLYSLGMRTTLTGEARKAKVVEALRLRGVEL